MLIALILLIRACHALDISGTYVAYINGKRGVVTLQVNENEGQYAFRMTGPNGLNAVYMAPKSAKENYILQDDDPEDMETKYVLHAKKDKLTGKVWVLPIGEVDIEFIKEKQTR